jgi:hypothetical protein
MEGLGLPILYIFSSVRKSDRSRRTAACGAGEPDTNQFFTQLMRLSGNPFQPVVVRKSSIRFPTDRDAGTYLFGFAALNPRGQPRMAEDQKTVRPSPKLGTHLK